MSYVIMGHAVPTSPKTMEIITTEVFYAGRRKWSTLIENARFFDDVEGAKKCIDNGLPEIPGLALYDNKVRICSIILETEDTVTILPNKKLCEDA